MIVAILANAARNQQEPPKQSAAVGRSAGAGWRRLGGHFVPGLCSRRCVRVVAMGPCRSVLSRREDADALASAFETEPAEKRRRDHSDPISMAAPPRDLAEDRHRGRGGLQRQGVPVDQAPHDLLYLWGLAKKGLGTLVLADAEMKGIERAVKSFSKFDPNSQAFRYPRLMGGKRSAPGLRLVDARGLDRGMARVASALELARYGLDGLLYQRNEARRSSNWY
jgi:hypothetical protein